MMSKIIKFPSENIDHRKIQGEKSSIIILSQRKLKYFYYFRIYPQDSFILCVCARTRILSRLAYFTKCIMHISQDSKYYLKM